MPDDRNHWRDDPVPLPGLDWLTGPLNGGFRPRGQYLLAGAPATNKSTLAVQVASAYARLGRSTLFILSEQSPEEARTIFRRVNGRSFGDVISRIKLESLNDIEELQVLLMRQNQESRPSLVVVDSLQGSGLPSTATRAYRTISAFQRTAKRLRTTTISIAHITKDGSIAGPKSLEHQIDACIFLRKAGSLRQLFVTKNRYGPEIVEPVSLIVRKEGVAPYPHSSNQTASVLGYPGSGDEPVEIQASATLPRYGGRAELNAPFLPSKRIRQLLTTISGLPGIDLQTVSYAINALIPDCDGYTAAIELPLTMALLAAYLRQSLPPRTIYAGGVDLRRNIRSVRPSHLAALAEMLAQENAPVIDTIYLSPASATLLSDLRAGEGDESICERINIIGVQTLDELVTRLWPEAFRSE